MISKFCLEGREQFVAATQLSLDKKDHVSRELLEDLLESEESYIDWLETQERAIKTVGSENYLAEQL